MRLPAFRPISLLALSAALTAACAEVRFLPARAEGIRAQTASSPPVRYLTGNPADVAPRLAGPGLLLAGGGEDQLAAMQWLIDAARGCSDCPARVDLVVLRASGADGYNSLVNELQGLDSVESLVFANRTSAETPEVIQTVARAEVVFFAGGDQCRYVEYFAGTGLARAVETVYARGGGVGGTSAGLAIMGSSVYDACKGSVTSPEALGNPHHKAISFSSGLFDWPQLRGLLTDTHFAQRDRMGRLMAFLARNTANGLVSGLAVDEATAIGLDAQGIGTVFGANRAYLVEPRQLAGTAPGRPLTDASFRIWRLNPGQSFDFRRRDQPGAYQIDVSRGKLSANPY